MEASSEGCQDPEEDVMEWKEVLILKQVAHTMTTLNNDLSTSHTLIFQLQSTTKHGSHLHSSCGSTKNLSQQTIL
jgi:hypothetical protein